MSRSARRALAWFALPLLLAFVLAGLWLYKDELVPAKVESSVPDGSPAMIQKGEYLARAGNCIACHTAPGQPVYTGGRAISTPFGDVYSTNLTPDIETGIGDWSAADFYRAMHHGISRDGRLLYPAFPYPNYTKVTREDSDAIYSYLRTLPAQRKPRIAAELRRPYNTQLALRVWRAIYFRPDELEAPEEAAPEVKRGAYLVEGLGHCNACHTARTLLGGSRQGANYAGGPIPTLGWDAPPLVQDRPISDAEADHIVELLAAGTSLTGVASGPMAEVVFHSLQYLKRDDIEAMVSYLRTLPPKSPPASRYVRVGKKQRQALMTAGSAIYSEHCASCHGDQGEGEPYKYPPLAGNASVVSASPNNALRAVLLGGYAPSTAAHPRPYGMPSFAHQLSDEEIAAVLTFVRGSWGNNASAVSPIEVSRK